MEDKVYKYILQRFGLLCRVWGNWLPQLLSLEVTAVTSGWDSPTAEPTRTSVFFFFYVSTSIKHKTMTCSIKCGRNIVSSICHPPAPTNVTISVLLIIGAIIGVIIMRLTSPSSQKLGIKACMKTLIPSYTQQTLYFFGRCGWYQFGPMSACWIAIIYSAISSVRYQKHTLSILIHINMLSS